MDLAKSKMLISWVNQQNVFYPIIMQSHHKKKSCDFDVSMVMHTIVVLAKRLEEQGRMCLPHCHSNNIAFVA